MYDHGPFDEAIQASHGNFTFSSDNEVLYFGDQPTVNGCVANYVLPGCCFLILYHARDIIQREICPAAITLGQIAQVQLKLQLLRQDNSSFTLRELLKGMYVLYD